MLGIHELWLFIISGLLLNITPGPDTAYIVGRSVQLGWRGGAAAALGIACGCLVHVFGAAIGLSALLMASSTAFAAVKLIGAAYLLYVGVKMLLSRARNIAAGDGERKLARSSLRQVFWQGALTDVLNPKVALFFLAFLPQFVAADSPHKRRGLRAAWIDFRFHRHIVVSWRRCVCGTVGRPHQAVGSRAGLDQPYARRAVRISGRAGRDARIALGVACGDGWIRGASPRMTWVRLPTTSLPGLTRQPISL